MLESNSHRSSFSLKRAIELSGGTSPAISGGTGLYLDDPIIVTELFFPFVSKLEKEVTSAVCEFYGFWDPKVNDELLKTYNHTVMHEVEISYEDEDEELRTTTIYFDISTPFATHGREYSHGELLKKYEELSETKTAEVVDNSQEFIVSVRESLVGGEEGLNDYLAIISEDMEKDKKLNDALKECGVLDSFHLITQYRLNSTI